VDAGVMMDKNHKTFLELFQKIHNSQDTKDVHYHYDMEKETTTFVIEFESGERMSFTWD